MWNNLVKILKILYNIIGDAMKNRGFTLIEMIAIVTILVAISLIVAPAIINTINDKNRI